MSIHQFRNSGGKFVLAHHTSAPVLALVIVLLIMLGNALPALAAPAKQVEFWTMQLSPFHDAYVQGVIAGFERENPDIKVKWVDIPWSEMERKTLTSIAAKSAPDVVNLNPQFSSKLAEFGALASPDSYLSKAEIATYVQPAWRGNQLNGKTFALPWYLNTNVVLYNKEIFAKAGVKVPETFDELLIAARLIKARTGSYTYFPALDGSAPLEAMVAMGGEVLTSNGCAPGFLEKKTGQLSRGETIFNYYHALYQEGLVPKNVVTEGHRKSVEMFLSGQVAMITTGMQFLQTIKTSNPSFYPNVGVAAQMGVVRDGKLVRRANIAAMNIAVLQSSRDPASAFAFAKYCRQRMLAITIRSLLRCPPMPS
jgi:putative chitobiose transport system substrate-binding protein